MKPDPFMVKVWDPLDAGIGLGLTLVITGAAWAHEKAAPAMMI
jgi:hypothetical protein